jgi:DNA gyrase subunit B
MFAAIGVTPQELKTGKIARDKFRVGKVILLSDADVDGNHIRTLLKTFFLKYVPQMFEMGMIYIVDMPLFQAEDKKKGKQMGYTLKEIQSKISPGTHITRFK